MRLQLLHELVLVTLGVDEKYQFNYGSTQSTHPRRNAWHWCCFWQIFCKHSAAQPRHWCRVSHLGFDTQKKRGGRGGKYGIRMLHDAAADLLKRHLPG